MKNGTRNKKISLAMLFICSSILLSTVAVLLVMSTSILMLKAGWLPLPDNAAESAQYVISTICSVCILVSALLTFALGKIPMAPFADLIDHMNCLAKGDLKTRYQMRRGLYGLPLVREMGESFNAMAQELENTQMLRDDFINNFSHEFKTPIVSIAGFARLLKRGNLSQKEREEYLDVIEEEALRLSVMATNILDLSRVEKQTSIQNAEHYNLSEQLRVCILMLENRWMAKNIEFDLDMGEYTITAGKELLKQVWINLLDNAVKFSPEDGLISVTIHEKEDWLKVTVINSGPEIASEERERIFEKFYQAEQSRSVQGNGVGLAIVKRVVELHHGFVEVESDGGMTAFTVTLPQKVEAGFVSV